MIHGTNNYGLLKGGALIGNRISSTKVDNIMCHYLIIFFVADFISKKSKESRFYLY
jgi:hypothetical protein